MDKETIHNKGFNISDSWDQLEYGKIKVGTKTLTDATLDLGAIQKTFPRHQYTNKSYIWKMMAEGVGDIKGLYLWYMGVRDTTIEEVTGIPCNCQKDEDKAARMLNYLLDDSVGSTEVVRAEAANLKVM